MHLPDLLRRKKEPEPSHSGKGAAFRVIALASAARVGSDAGPGAPKRSSRGVFGGTDEPAGVSGVVRRYNASRRFAPF